MQKLGNRSGIFLHLPDEKLYLYFAKDLEFVGEHPDEGEILKTFEISRKEFVKKIHSGEISDAKSVCAVMRAFYD